MGYMEQYGVLFVALLLGGGFAFGGIASYAGLTGSGNSTNKKSNYTLPSSHFKDGEFSTTFRERRVLAYNKNLVFATGYYRTADGKSSLESLRDMQGTFGDSMYFSVVNASDVTVPISESRIDSYPILVLIGGNQNGPTAFVENPTAENLGSNACSVYKSLDTLSQSGRTYCATR